MDAQTQPQGGQSYNDREQELIQQLVESRLAQHEELEFESLDDYVVPPPTQFSMLAKPAVCIKYPHITFSMSSIRLFEGVQHVLPIIAEKRRRLGIIPLADEEAASLQWAREKDERWVNRAVSAANFLNDLYPIMKWHHRFRYKIFGHIANSPRGLILVFDLGEALVFTGKKSEVIDPRTGETKQKWDMYYPEQYKNTMGTPYEDYVSGHQMNFFEDFGDLFKKTYTDIPEEDYIEDTGELPKTAANN